MAPVSSYSVLSPVGLGAALRNWWRSTDYVAATGNWIPAAGAGPATLAQATAGKRPTKTAANAAFNNRPTVDCDGVDDDLKCTFGMSTQPNTLGILMRLPGAGAGDYVVGQYAATSYQFYNCNLGADRIYSDPAFANGGFFSAGLATAHLFLFSKSGTSITVYKDGLSLGSTTMSSSSGAPNDFYLGSAGGGYAAVQTAELFTVDRAITVQEARRLTSYFRGVGYPI